MRHNPTHQNTCAMRIGMYREGQCTDGPHPCQFLDECDWHYDEKTGEWDYPDLPKPEIKPRISRTGRYGSGANHHAGASNIGKALYDKRWRLVAKGLASWVPIRTTLSEALEVAGL